MAFLNVAQMIVSIVLVLLMLSQVREGGRRPVRQCSEFRAYPAGTGENYVPVHHCPFRDIRGGINPQRYLRLIVALTPV